ncbi:AEC family transporter [Candidatus Saccharibacteria bacterium]|nr:AEC family transporter [Candidatus Saccharibacteria bacterium]
MGIDLSLFYTRLGSIALIIALGFLLGRLKLISTDTNKQLVNLLLTVFMPAALFSAFPETYDDSTAKLFYSGLIAGIVVMLAMAFLAKLIFTKLIYKGELRFESQFAFIFNNATFLGYPIVVNTFGDSGVIAYCGFIIAFNIALFSYGVYLFERKIDRKALTRIIKNPNILAVLAGMVIFLAGLKLPEFVTDSVSLVGSATTPLSVICIGFMLSRADFKKLIRRWRLILTATIQLIIGPVLTFIIVSLLRFPAEVIAVCTLIQTLPTATSLSLFATKYGGNEIESSELVAISTVLSVITMPLMVWLLLS